MVYDKYASNEHFDTFIHVNVEESTIDNKIYDLCNRVFDSKIVYYKDNKDRIEQVINFIKTIFKDYNITGMIVHVKGKKSYTSVTIKNNRVINFEKIKDEEMGKIGFIYGKNGIKLECSNNDLNELSNYEEITKLFDKSMNTIVNINKNNDISLSLEERNVITMYKEFFGNYPDLSNIDEYNKVQPMMWLLTTKLDDNMFGDYTVRYSKNPKSCILRKIQDNIVPYGQTTKLDAIKLSSDKIELINNMGSIVNDYISRYKSSQEILDNIATVSYIKNKMVTSFYEIDDIVSASKGEVNEEQVEEILEFLANLDTALNSPNPYETYKSLESGNKIKTKTK